jgi:UDP-glucose 4-epimerase
MLNILIVGSHSRVGQELAGQFGEDANVVFGGRSSSIKINLSSNTDTIELPSNTDVVINCAALFSSSNTLDVIDATQVNVVGALRLLEACQKAGVKKFIQVSSIFASMPTEIVEKSAYALQNRTADELLLLAAKNGNTQVACLRASALYGPYGFQRAHQPFLESILNSAATGEVIVLRGKHDVYRNYLHVHDFATIVWRTLKSSLGGIFDCPGTTYSYSEIARSAINNFRTSSQIVFQGTDETFEDKIPYNADSSLYKSIDFSIGVDLDRAMTIYWESRRALV